MEALEGRILPATLFPVTTTSDSGPGSLRQEIMNVDQDSSTGVDVIDFSGLVPEVSGIVTIALSSALPAITRGGVIVDGTTALGFTAAPIIELNGANAGPTASGLVLAAPPTAVPGGDTVQGLIFDQFSGGALLLWGTKV